MNALFFILPLSNSIINHLIPRVFPRLSIASTFNKLPEGNSLEVNISEFLAMLVINVNPVFTDTTEENRINSIVSNELCSEHPIVTKSSDIIANSVIDLNLVFTDFVAENTRINAAVPNESCQENLL